MTFTLPTSMAPKVVFIQYLAALAISEALDPGTEGGRSEGVLGVRIKWPNDVYALVKGEGGKIEKVKIGGILVNSNYSNGKFRVMAGEYSTSFWFRSLGESSTRKNRVALGLT